MRKEEAKYQEVQIAMPMMGAPHTKVLMKTTKKLQPKVEGEKMKTFFLFCALIGLFLGTITVSAAPATPEHPIVKEIVGYMLNQPAEMEKKIADAIDRFKVEKTSSVLSGSK